MTPKTLLLATCVAVFAAISLSGPRSAAQSVQAPALSGEETPPETGPVAQITMDDGTGLTQKIRGRHGRRVLLRPGRRTTIILQYDRSLAGVPVQVAALDSGKASFPGNRNVVDGSGRIVLQFSDAQRPGLYRVALNCGGIVSTLQFWVPDPDGSGGDASIQVPARTSTSSR
jgi:hypothetical protein